MTDAELPAECKMKTSSGAIDKTDSTAVTFNVVLVLSDVHGCETASVEWNYSCDSHEAPRLRGRRSEVVSGPDSDTRAIGER